MTSLPFTAGEVIEFPEVAAGIAWLDNRVPGWAAKINLETLDLSSSADCVICQATAIRDYEEACTSLEMDIDFNDRFQKQEDVELGFDYQPCPNGFGSVYWFKHAEAQWRRAIADRLTR